MRSTKNLMQEMTWLEARKELLIVAKKFVEIVDEISPDENLTLFKVCYPFGQAVNKTGNLLVPNSAGDFVPLSDPSIPSHIQNKLNYSEIPLGILSKNTAETYQENKTGIFVRSIGRPGKIVGVWPSTGCTKPYNIVAGARTVFMLPDIAMQRKHKKLVKAFHLNSILPKNKFLHWNMFKQIIDSDQFEDTWEMEVYYLSNEWLEKLKQQDSSFLSMKNYITHYALEKSSFIYKDITIHLLFNEIANFFNADCISINPYGFETLKHLFFVITGMLPAFVPFNGNEDSGPFNLIQEIYTDIYGLDQNPTIIIPKKLSSYETSIYYSLNMPGLITQPQNTYTTNIDYLRWLQDAMKACERYFIHEKRLNDVKLLKDQTVSELLQKIKLELFHFKQFIYGNVQDCDQLPIYDDRFLYSSKKESHLPFASYNNFTKGVVKITPIYTKVTSKC